MSLLSEARLYGIVDLGYLPEGEVISGARELIAGGVTLLQLRAKTYDQSRILSWAKELQSLCREEGVCFIVNDHVEVAAEVGADGLHLGQDDGSLSVARDQLGPGVLVGRSTHAVAQARKALTEGADYIGFGPLFPTPTKEGRPGIGLEDVALVQSEVGSRIPVFCIGGIKRANLEHVLKAGARRVVVVSDLLTADDRQAAAGELLNFLAETAL